MLTKTKFLLLFVSVLSGLFIATACISVVIDPFGMFRIINIDGFNSKKFSYFSETYIKPIQVSHSNANYIFIGDSRANTTFASNLDHVYFKGAQIYSAGMAGQSIYADYRMLQHIQDMQMTHITIFVDHLSFFTYSPLKQTFVIENSDFSHRLNYHEDGTKNYAQWLQKFRDAALLLCSFNIFQESLETIQKQNKDIWHLQKNGTWTGDYLFTDKSQQKLFDFMEKDLLLKPLADIPDTQRFYETPSNINTFSTFEKLIDLAYRLKIKVDFVIPPTHVRMHEIMFSMGRWSDYESWKRQFVFINEKIATEQNSTPFTIWDFTAYNSITTEAVPPLSDKSTRMHWFVDDVHGLPILGKLMLDQMSSYTADNNFVTVLTSQSVEYQLASLRAGHTKYLQQHSKEVLQIYKLCTRAYKDSARCVAPTVDESFKLY